MDKTFSQFASRAAKITGTPATFLVCVALVVVWAVSGPIFKFSETWQLVINTGTTIITFLMVFLIQNTQNRDSAAVQAKLDELILNSAAQDGFIGIEDLSDKELESLHSRLGKAADSHERLATRLDEEVKRRKDHGSSDKKSRTPAKSGKSGSPRKRASAPRRKASTKAADSSSGRQ
ncbi:MAG: low affinity iron permease family protein [Caulobacter sp.]|nr:low affinity iron permease family protein [Caulobacter sp.]